VRHLPQLNILSFEDLPQPLATSENTINDTDAVEEIINQSRKTKYEYSRFYLTIKNKDVHQSFLKFSVRNQQESAALFSVSCMILALLAITMSSILPCDKTLTEEECLENHAAIQLFSILLFIPNLIYQILAQVRKRVNLAYSSMCNATYFSVFVVYFVVTWKYTDADIGAEKRFRTMQVLGVYEFIGIVFLEISRKDETLCRIFFFSIPMFFNLYQRNFEYSNPISTVIMAMLYRVSCEYVAYQLTKQRITVFLHWIQSFEENQAFGQLLSTMPDRVIILN
jgi:hypothetical protein